MTPGDSARRLSASRLFAGILNQVYAHRRAVGLLFYVVATFLAYTAAYALRFDVTWPRGYVGTYLTSLPALLAVRLLFGFHFRVGSARWRFIGTRDLIRLVTAASLGSVIFALLARCSLFDPVVPYSIVVLEWTLNMAITGGVWMAYRLGFEHWRARTAPARVSLWRWMRLRR